MRAIGSAWLIGCALTILPARGTLAHSAASDMADAPLPEARASDVYEITINGIPQGDGQALRIDGGLYMDVALAASANLKCGRIIDGPSGRKFCAIPVTQVTIKERRLDATVPPRAFLRAMIGKAAPVQPIPEMTPGNLGFLNYNLGGSKVEGGWGFTGSLNAGLRLEENAFDVGVVIARAAKGGFGSVRRGDTNDLLSIYDDGRTTVLVTDAAYRRNWFDRRLSLAIGRTSVASRGVIGGSLFDGIGLQKDNLDNLGDVRTTRASALSGYNPTPGVLTYRVGNTVLKQVPLPAGPYTIDPALFQGLPGNGNIEITGLDGRVSSLDLAVQATRQVVLFPRGTFDWNVQVGRVRTAAGDFAAAVTAGTRYGITDDLTGEIGLLADTRSAILDTSLDARLPRGLGVAGATAAVQFRKMDAHLGIADQSGTGWALRGYYEKRWSSFTIGGDYQRNIHGGTIVGGYRRGYYDSYGTGINGNSQTNIGSGGYFSSTFLGSIIEEEVRLYASTPIFKTGINANLRLVSTDYRDQPRRARYAETQLSAGLGRWGNVGTFVRAGRTGFGQDEFSANAYWMIPLGGRTQVGLNYQTNRLDGRKSSEDRYALTVNGSQDGHWDQASNYNASIDQAGNGTLDYQRRFRALDASIGVYRYDHQGVTGSVNARGSVVVADGQVTAGRALNDDVVLLRAPQLAYEDVFQDNTSKPTTRIDGHGNAVVAYTRRYKPNRVQVAGDKAPLGLEIPDNVLPGTVHPYRGYVVDVATHLARPARLFAALPAAAKGVDVYADVNGEAIPVEADGSIYVDDLTRLKGDIPLMWGPPDRQQTCTIPAATLSAADAASETVQIVKGLPCR